MKWISFSLFILMTSSLSFLCWADPPPSYRMQHPIGMMHALPVGETPGWSKPWWMSFEIANGNVWNAPLKLTDLKTGTSYEYTADFEQTNIILGMGAALTEKIALSFDLPFVHRDGGVMDSVIDGFHVMLTNRRFNRQYYPQNQNIFSIKTDDVDYYEDNSYTGGLPNVVAKLKFWIYKNESKKKGACPCGVAIASQTKIPLQSEKLGGTTGDVDQSVLLHYGIPLFNESGVWLTAGHTFLGDNPAMREWPRKEYSTLYELNLDLAVNTNWGFLFNARAESPLIDKDRVTYFDVESSPAIRSRNRAASGWSSLVNWRGSESIGLRYRTTSGATWQFIVAEDWGVGSYDTRDNLYTNNAPDVNFVIQSNW